ncbi:MAG: hypothetical protein PHW69_09955 [Elusimicrobiaceae bacterium]|nr:hypothetical protein [Elusimicrobiaceae bacterium]
MKNMHSFIAALCWCALSVPAAAEPGTAFTSRPYNTVSEARIVAESILKTGAPLGLRFDRLEPRQKGGFYILRGQSSGPIEVMEYNAFNRYGSRQEATAAVRVLASAFKSAGLPVLASSALKEDGKYSITIYYACQSNPDDLKKFSHHTLTLQSCERGTTKHLKTLGIPVIETGKTGEGFKITLLSKGAPLLASGKRSFATLAQAAAAMKTRREELAAGNALVLFSNTAATPDGYNYGIAYIE